MRTGLHAVGMRSDSAVAVPFSYTEIAANGWSREAALQHQPGAERHAAHQDDAEVWFGPFEAS